MFDGSWTASAPYTSEAHLAQMEAILSKIPQSLLSRSRDRDRSLTLKVGRAALSTSYAVSLS